MELSQEHISEFDTLEKAIEEIKNLHEHIISRMGFEMSLRNCFGDEIEQLEAENAALKAQLEWQPIETAPKDETPILLIKISFFDNHNTYCVVKWDKSREAWYQFSNSQYHPDHPDYFTVYPKECVIGWRQIESEVK